MPETQVVFYQKIDGQVPVLEWLRQLVKQNRKAYANCVARIGQLAANGYELRAKHVRVQYRILYFFSGQNVAILAHAMTKEEEAVPAIEIERALRRKRLFEENPLAHTYMELSEE